MSIPINTLLSNLVNQVTNLHPKPDPKGGINVTVTTSAQENPQTPARPGLSNLPKPKGQTGY
jgi:hypothetical protein